MHLALAKPYKPSSTLTPTKANASTETPSRWPIGRLRSWPGPCPNQKGHPVGCRHCGAGQVGALAWPSGGGLGLAMVSSVRVRVFWVRDLAQRETAQTTRTWPKLKEPHCRMQTQWRQSSRAGAWPRGGRLGLARISVRVSSVRVRASSVRVLAQRETAQTTMT